MFLFPLLSIVTAQSTLSENASSTGKPHCPTVYNPGAPLSNPTCQECVPSATPPPGFPPLDLPVCSWIIQPTPSPTPTPSVQFVLVTPAQQSSTAIQSQQDSSVNVGMVVGITFGCFAFVLLLAGLFLYARRSSKQVQKKPSIIVAHSNPSSTNVRTSALPQYPEGMNIGEFDSSFVMPKDL
jgi:hypothetical protein